MKKTLTACLFLVAVVAAQDGAVRVTASLANIRQQPSETARVLTQVTKDTVLALVAVEGDWFKVRVPMGEIRLEAYISKKVAKLEAAAPGSAPAATPKVEAVPVRDGMSVALLVDQDLKWLQPAAARVIQIGDKVDSIARSGSQIPAGDAMPPGATGGSAVTYVWVADGGAAARVIDTKRPSFYVGFKEVPGFGADDLSPMIVRLAPAGSGVRAVAAVRGRADQSSRAEADWDVMKDLKQDVVKTEVDPAERGVVKLTPVADLAPGQYAVVLRPAAKKKLSGTNVLRTSGEARLFGVLWDFTIK